MNKINNQNVDALKVFFGASQAKKAVKEEKQQEAEIVKDFEAKKVEASALEAAAAQNRGAMLAKVDTSDAAVERRLAEAFANAPFMKALNELQGEEEEFDFVKFAFANIQGVDQAKLAKHLEQPLHNETVEAAENLFI